MNSPPITFSDWMNRALFDPEEGYYTRRAKAVGGPEADFTTAADVLGPDVAAWIAAEAAHWGWRRVNVIEVGPGEGVLAKGIAQALGWLGRRRVTLRLVEKSPVLQARQRLLLGKSALWHDSLSSALHACDGEALVISNELVDAFPCDVHRKNGSSWEKLHLLRRDGVWREIWLPDDTPPEPFSALRNPCPDGWRVETHGSWRTWFLQQTEPWRRGSLWTCDYGEKFPGLYHRRPRGTLRAYARHQRLEGGDVYARQGRQDITADVNFTDLEAWGRERGLETTWLGPLADFVAPDAPPHLCDLQGAGGAFQVLCQRLRS